MKQKQALDILKSGRNVYLTGAAGSGKTYVLNEYIRHLKNHGVVVGVTASTGIAATHIGGMTIHSWSGIGIKENISVHELEEMDQKQYLWKRFEKVKVLIIDEVSMLTSDLLDSIERICRHMKRNEDPFGGIQIVLSGDFFQLPPVVRGGGNIKFIDVSDAWNTMDIRVCYLEEQYRHNDDTLEHILNEMRTGDVTDKTKDILRNCSKLNTQNIKPTRLFSHNTDVDILNEEELNKILEKEVKYEMLSKGKVSVITSLKKSVLAPEVLSLKKGAVVMFVKNSFDQGYVNGTLGIVEDFEDNVPIVRTFSDKRIYVFSSEWSIEEDGKVLGSVTQLPLRLAWAITIHKSQGMSMDSAEIDLSKSFVEGQGYVALSRLRSLKGLILKGINEMAFAVNSYVLKLDKKLLSESNKWELVIARFSKNEMQEMHDKFIKKSGGTLDEKEIKRNKEKEVKEIQPKVSTLEKTKLLLDEKLSLKDIAKKRGFTVSTILSHFEKLKEQDSKIDFSQYKPKASDLKIIKKAFKESGGVKMSPVHEMLEGKYTYEELRLARLYM